MTEQAKKETIHILKKPFVFEGRDITEVDLSCIDNLTKGDVDIAINRHSAREKKIGDNYLMDPNYLLDILCLSMGEPFEFFDQIGGKDYQFLPLKVLGFLTD